METSIENFLLWILNRKQSKVNTDSICQTKEVWSYPWNKQTNRVRRLVLLFKDCHIVFLDSFWGKDWKQKNKRIIMNLFSVMQRASSMRDVCKLLHIERSDRFSFNQTYGQKKSKLFFHVDVSSKKPNSTLLLWNLRLTCFRSFFGGNWSYQKDIPKLSDL